MAMFMWHLGQLVWRVSQSDSTFAERRPTGGVVTMPTRVPLSDIFYCCHELFIMLRSPPDLVP